MKQKTFPEKYRIQLFAGAIFLFNPCFNIVDILPDVIGWGLIAHALTQYSVADGEFSQSRRYALMLFWVSALKLLLSPAVAVSSVNDDKLLATVCFAVAECVFVAMLGGMADEICYLTGRYADEKTAAKSNDTMQFCKLFMQLKIWLPLLPELTSLAADEAHADNFNSDEWTAVAGMRGILTLLVTAVVLVLGIMYLVRISSLYRAVKSDGAYNDVLRAKYAEAEALDVHRTYRSRVKLACVTACVGVCCFIDLSVSGKPVITPVIGMVLIGAFGFISGHRREFKRTAVSLAVALPFETAATCIKCLALPSDLYDILQMNTETLLTGLAAAALSACAWIIFGYFLMRDIQDFSRGLQPLRHGFKAPVVCFSLMLILRNSAMILPFLRAWVVTPYGLLCAIGAITAVNAFMALYEAATKNKKAE